MKHMNNTFEQKLEELAYDTTAESHPIMEYALENATGKKHNQIFAVLYDSTTDSHLYLFNLNRSEGYCTMMCEPIDEERAYCELSLPFLSDIDSYYGDYSIVTDDPNIGKDYRGVMHTLKRKEARLLLR